MVTGDMILKEHVKEPMLCLTIRPDNFLRSLHTLKIGKRTVKILQIVQNFVGIRPFSTRRWTFPPNQNAAAATGGFVHLLPGLFPEAFVTWIGSLDGSSQVEGPKKGGLNLG